MAYVWAILAQCHHTGITFYNIYLLFYKTLISSRLGFNFADTTGQDSESVIASCNALSPRSINTKILKAVLVFINTFKCRGSEDLDLTYPANTIRIVQIKSSSMCNALHSSLACVIYACLVPKFGSPN